MTIENEKIDESALFDNAVSDEPEVNPEPELQIEQLADAKAEIEAKAEPEAEAEKPAVDDNAPQVPSWRVREINEEKRAAIAERDALLAERANWQRQQPKPEPTKEEQDAAKAAKPDPLLDPDAYEAHIKREIREELLNDRRESSLANAHKTYKAEFEEAYAAAQKQVDPALRARMQQSRDPGETLVEWHREQKAKAEVGTDLTAYKAKLLEEALKDPEFRKAAMEAWRAEGQPQSNGRPRVDLPPSLNGASRSNAALRPGNDDVSDAELFEQTTG
jgi:hypothetical protein